MRPTLRCVGAQAILARCRHHRSRRTTEPGVRRAAPAPPSRCARPHPRSPCRPGHDPRLPSGSTARAAAARSWHVGTDDSPTGDQRGHMDRGGGPSLRTRVTLLAVVGLVLLALIAVRRVGGVRRRAAHRRRRRAAALAGSRPQRRPGRGLRPDRPRVARLRADRRRQPRHPLRRPRSSAWTPTPRPCAPLLAVDPALAADLRDVEDRLRQWLAPAVVEPAVAPAPPGPLSRGERTTSSAASTTAFRPGARPPPTTLQDSVNDARDAAFEDLSAVARGAWRSRSPALAAAPRAAGVAYLLLRRWVLTPLRRSAAAAGRGPRGRRERMIEPSGPPELRAVGADAESMRRALVARPMRRAPPTRASPCRARWSRRCAPTSPPRSTPSRRTCTCHGELHPAEGVLAGDWWASSPSTTTGRRVLRGRRVRPRRARGPGHDAPAALS